jgi:hypothetical protein
MRATVLQDPRLARHAGRFVWLEIDGENERNAAYLEKFPVQAFPSLIVIDPAEERAILKWPGTATVEQLERLLADATRALRKGARGADLVLARADRAHAEWDAALATRLYADAIAQGGAGWSHRGRAAEALLYLLSLEDAQRCAREADRLLPTLGKGASAANVAITGLGCAGDLPEDAADRAELAARLEQAARAALRFPGLLPIDRLGIYETVHAAREQAKDEEGAQAIAREWWAAVQGVRAEAKGSRARAAYVEPLAAAAVASGRPAEALPGLAADERALPDDYDPPFYTARILAKLGRGPEALAAADRALAKAYGPRRLRIQDLRATLQEEQGDRAAARATLEDAVAEAAKLPRAQLRNRERRLEQKLQQRLAALAPKES